MTEAGFHYAYGNYVIIDHGTDAEGHTWQTLYAHLDTIDTETGRQTAQGDRIGTVGSTGNSTGNHLHFEIRRDDALMPPAVLPAVFRHAAGAKGPEQRPAGPAARPGHAADRHRKGGRAKPGV